MRSVQPSTGGTPASFDRRSLLKGAALGAALAGTGAVAGCGATTVSGSTTKDGKAIVRVWSWYGEQQKQLPRLVQDFQDRHPNIVVENRIFGTPDQYLPALQAAVAGGDVPEIFAPHTRALTYGQAGISADLRSELGADFLGDFFESANQEYTLDGKQYGVGWMAQTFGIFYNPRLLRRAGVDGESIETWDDLIDAADKINKTDTYGVALSCNPTTSSLDFFLPLLTQVSDDPTFYLKLDQLEDGFSYTHPTVIKAIALLKKIVDARVFQPGTTGTSGDQAPQLFYTGKSAMLFNGSWTPQGLTQNATKDFNESYKVMKTPAIAAGRKHWCANQAGAGWSVSETSRNKDAALEFLRFLYQTDRYSATMNESNSMPSTKSAATKINSPVMRQMTSWLLEGEGCPHIPFGPGSVAAGDALAPIFQGKGRPADIGQQMQDAVLNAKGA
ncbi:ABC transporter substrate-binding protein [Microlunatus soli]|uniref:ABC-type glycerol-3-phosphate transport system, substrate-binding protein n=1 Tax=Microlunatus soli TaxID=630515 RepID=A0A1H1NJ93_9ACTN|nr:extracellular solute-binding protein [Microlunatus soli]SDR99028.1 ABC-type glycerol-3-phosphate transport system, substrate-binding protein [Microlunatus soli]